MSFTQNLVSIKDLSLFDYLQLMIATNKDKNIVIYKNKKMGVIVIKDNKVSFAIDYLGNRAENAFYNICSWESPNFREIDLEEEIEGNIKTTGNILLKATEYIDRKEAEVEINPDLDDLLFDCEYPEIKRLFVKNKVKYIDLDTENKLIENVINGLIVDYNIETLAVLKTSDNENKIIALHSCDLIDYCDLFCEIFKSISQTILNKKFSLNVTQYQLKLDNNRIMVAEILEGTNYLIALEVNTLKVSIGIILNVFLPLLKEELTKILLD